MIRILYILLNNRPRNKSIIIEPFPITTNSIAISLSFTINCYRICMIIKLFIQNFLQFTITKRFCPDLKYRSVQQLP